MGWKIWSTLLLTPQQSKKVDMSHCPSHNRLPSEGEGAKTSMCKSTSPTTLQV